MAQKIPFFNMFADLLPPPELKIRLGGAVITGAVIDQSSFVMELQITTRQLLTEEDIDVLQKIVAATYGFSAVKIQAECSEPAPTAPAADSPASGGKASVPTGDVLLGKPIKAKSVPMRELSLKMGSAVVTGQVFFVECRETRRPGMWRLSFDMTDYTNSVSVCKNLTAKEAETFGNAIQPGMWLTVQGKMEPTWDGKDIQMNPYNVNKAEHKSREDKAEVKRVELHMHTRMSTMDALTDTAAAVKQAAAWGHRAVAITDHGCAHSFPDAMHAVEGKKAAKTRR